MALELPAIRATRGIERSLFLQLHLAMQHVHSLEAEFRGAVDHGFNREFLLLEMPVGIRGDAKFDPLLKDRRRRSLLGCGRKGENGRSGGGEKSSAIHGWVTFHDVPIEVNWKRPVG